VDFIDGRFHNACISVICRFLCVECCPKQTPDAFLEREKCPDDAGQTLTAKGIA
jgi:hypothetical protein